MKNTKVIKKQKIKNTCVRQEVTSRMLTNLSIEEKLRQVFASWALNYWVLVTGDVKTRDLYSFIAKTGVFLLVCVRHETRDQNTEVELELKLAMVLEQTEQASKSCPLWKTEKTVVGAVCPSLVHSRYALMDSLLVVFRLPVPPGYVENSWVAVNNYQLRTNKK